MTAGSLAERRAGDLETRRHAQREFRRPLVVEAGAGTGKTATLVSRIVAWCLGPGWQRAHEERPEAPPRRLAARVLEGVVAITFTEAAAAEMAGRVESTLRSLESGEAPATLLLDSPPPEEVLRERARALRGSVDHLVVQTIHAWCRRLLAAHPVEAGLPPRFEVDADGRRRRAVVRDLLEERLREAYAQPGDPRLLELAVAGAGPGELEEVLRGLMAAGVEAEAFAADPLSPARIGGELALLRACVDAFAGSGIEAVQRGTRVAKAQSLLEAILGLQQQLADAPRDREALAGLCDWLVVHFHEALLPHLRGYARGNFTKSESKVLDGCEPRVEATAGPLHELLSGWLGLDVRFLAAQHAALAPLLSEAQARARARGFCSYEGLLSGCARLLSQYPRVAAQVRGDIHQLLVDEFQDTDARQCQIVAQLALEGPPAERPGLFVVGDPKQSIYGWRSADLAAYDDFVARVLEAGGERRSLSVNHRSVPAVLEEVERCIAPVMRAVPGLQPAFESLVVSEAHSDLAGFHQAGFAPVEHWLPVRWQPREELPTRTRSREATQIEARALAHDLLRLREECGVSWRDVGVLFRGRGDWEIYLQELRAAGVLFNVEGDRNYFRRREIIDAAAWLRCVMDPGDELALLAMLRSPSVGVPDAALQPLFAAGLPARVRALRGAEPAALGELYDLVRKVAANPPKAVPGLERVGAWALNLEAALGHVARLRESLVVDPGDVFVEKLRAYTLLEVSEAGRFLGSWRVANLERFFSELAGRFAAGVPQQEILRDLREGVSLEESREEAPLRDLVPDAVRVLTLHGAKGLAFDHVYLMQLHKAPGPDRDGVASRWLEGQLEYHLQGTHTLGWGRARAARAAVADAERARLLYVGATRARQRLVVSGLPPSDAHRGRGGALSALLETRRPERPDAIGVVGRCLEAGSDRCELAAALHVVPALRSDAEAPLRPRESPVLPDAVRIQRDEAQLREARHSARTRMRRPLAATASSTSATPHAAAKAAWASLPGEAERAGGLGSAVHGVLEALDLSLPREAALRAALAGLEARLPQWFETAQLAAGRSELEALLEQISKGALFARLFELGECVLARELPLLLRPGPDDAALAYVSGSIDLLYRDPQDGQLVVVDYKTDRAADAIALEARAAHHAHQGRYYVRALREAFALPVDPRFELWFLRHDRCLVPDLAPH